MLTVDDLFVAVNEGNVGEVKSILERCTFDINVCRESGTVLHVACNKRNVCLLLGCCWLVISWTLMQLANMVTQH